MQSKGWFLGLTLLSVGVYFTMRPNRNVRNNNPLNIRENEWANDDWLGEHERDIDSEFEEFESPEYGFRAAYKILKRYQDEYHLYSLHSIVNRWAPSSENHTDEYIEYLAEKMDKWTWTPVTESEMPALLYWMAEFEGAKGAFTMEQVERGIALA